MEERKWETMNKKDLGKEYKVSVKKYLEKLGKTEKAQRQQK